MHPSRSASRSRDRKRLPCWLALPALALGLACAPRHLAPLAPSGDTQAGACHPEQDRAAILQMAGTYRVEFAFDETVSLQEGYSLKSPYRASATEVVRVLEDTPHKVSLQHLLVMERDGQRAPLKHWRQDWTFEDTELLEFRGRRTWERHALPPSESRCTWSQAVFEVDDGPRYEGSGRWTHARGLSAWESRETWRPLPRREYTKRADYDALVGTNRHALTPTGWVHEQDSLKLVLGPTPYALARERGVNLYTRQPGEGTAPEVSAYWTRTQDYWREVREQWRALFQEHARFTLKDRVDDKPRHDHLFGLSESSPQGPNEGAMDGAPTTRQRLRAILTRFLEPEADTKAEHGP